MKNITKSALHIIIAVVSLIAVSIPAYAARTQTVWTTSGAGGVDVIPYVRVDKKALFVDFEHSDFDSIDYIYYNLNYDTDEPESKRGVEGTIYPRVTDITAYYEGRPYIRRELVFGTCSQGVCDYYRNPKSMKLTVNTKFFSGKVVEHTEVIGISDDQLK